MPKEMYIDENGNERILSSSPSALSGLLDTDITTPSANQVLAYDGSKWGNVDLQATDVEYSSGVTVKNKLDKQVSTLDKTNFTFTNAVFTNEQPSTRLFQINLDVSSTELPYTKINVEFTTTGIKMAGYGNGTWTTFWNK